MSSLQMPPETPSMTAELLERYLANEVTIGERAAVDAWLAREPRRALIVEQLRMGRGATVQTDLREQWQRLDARRSIRARQERDGIHPDSRPGLHAYGRVPPRAPPNGRKIGNGSTWQIFVRGMICVLATITSGIYIGHIVSTPPASVRLQQMGHLYLSPLRTLTISNAPSYDGHELFPSISGESLTRVRSVVQIAALRTARVVSQSVDPYRRAFDTRNGML